MVEFYIHAFLVSRKQHSKMLLYGLKIQKWPQFIIVTVLRPTKHEYLMAHVNRWLRVVLVVKWIIRNDQEMNV